MPDGRFIGPCCTCKSEIWLPTPLYESARHSEKIVFHCPYGHEQVFRQGDTEATKLRRERDRLLQRTIQLDEARVEAERRAEAAEAAAFKVRKRAKAGTCPCCHRTFRQMALHMAKQHPEFKAVEVAA
jgi:hypothetical protein